MSQVSISRVNGVSTSSGRLDKRSRLRDVMENPSSQSRDTSEFALVAADHDDDALSLEFFYASLYATVLEDTITEMRILNECNNGLRMMKTMTDIEELRADKFGIAKPSFTDELDGVDEKALNKEEYKLDKLAADRKLISDTILLIYMDLSLNRSFQCLTEQLREILDKDIYRVALLAEEAQNRLTRRELSKQIRTQRNHNKSANYDVNVIIDGLMSQVEDANLNSEVRSRYITNWEKARTEQNMQYIHSKEAPLYNNVVVNKQKLDSEQRVHAEVMLLVHLAINETMEKVEKIMNKYDTDIEEIDLKIQIMKNNYQSAKDRRMELEARYEIHDKQTKDWLHFKEEREKARQYQLKMTNAAIVAQAWWRGLMVRLQLGPYKPTKGRRPTLKRKEKK